MAEPTVYQHQLDGLRAKLSGDGWEFETSATVEGVTGASPFAKFKAAVEKLGAKIGDSISAEDRGVVLQEIAPEAVTGDTVRLRLIYRQKAPPKFPTVPGDNDHTTLDQVEVGASLVSKDTNKDASGNLVVFKYKGKEHAWTGTKLCPEVTGRIIRQEDGSPAAAAKTFVGTVNKAGWSVDMSAPEGAWICSGIVGRSSDGGNTYTVEYSFQYDRDSWNNKTVAFINPETGYHPKDADDGDEIEQEVSLYPVMDFNDLGL